MFSTLIQKSYTMEDIVHIQRGLEDIRFL